MFENIRVMYCRKSIEANNFFSRREISVKANWDFLRPHSLIKKNWQRNGNTHVLYENIADLTTIEVTQYI